MIHKFGGILTYFVFGEANELWIYLVRSTNRMIALFGGYFNIMYYFVSVFQLFET